MSIFFKASGRDSRLGYCKLKILGNLNPTNEGLFKILYFNYSKNKPKWFFSAYFDSN
jgi:hypothetical protein